MNDISILLNKLKIKTNNYYLYERAIMHTSYAFENNTESNERLEFLGDAVLELLMSDFLVKKYKSETEGFLTKIRAKQVCEEALVVYANYLDLKSFLKLGKGESIKGATNAIIADSFEALLGAHFLDFGFEKTKVLFNKIVIPYLKETEFLIDFKTELQEKYVNKKKISYKLLEIKGPPHQRIFKVACYMDDVLTSRAEGKTKKEAEQMAAKIILEGEAK